MYSKEETKALRIEFWENFNIYSEAHKLRKNKRPVWILHRNGIRNLSLKFNATRDYADVILELSQRNENNRLKGFTILQEYASVIEKGYNGELIWEFVFTRESGQEVSRVYCRLENVDIMNRAHWEVIFDFFVTRMHFLERNVLKIKDILKEEFKDFS